MSQNVQLGGQQKIFLKQWIELQNQEDERTQELMEQWEAAWIWWVEVFGTWGESYEQWEDSIEQQEYIRIRREEYLDEWEVAYDEWDEPPLSRTYRKGGPQSSRLRTPRVQRDETGKAKRRNGMNARREEKIEADLRG